MELNDLKPEGAKLTTHERIEAWNKYYEELSDAYLFPNEYVLRCFLGNYPNLKMVRNYAGAQICDVSCGDGRNMTLLNKLKFQIYGTEVSDKICELTRRKLFNHPDRINADIRRGYNWDLPFESDFFDYLLSWNASYYMEDESSEICSHINEFARVLKKDGYLVASVPSPKCFTLTGAEELGNHLIRIRTKSKWDLLNGTIYYRFESFDHIESVFGEHFRNFQKCKISDDCFGNALDYFVFVCQKR